MNVTRAAGNRIGLGLATGLLLFLVGALPLEAGNAEALFDAGVKAYRLREYGQAAAVLRQSSELRPASGTLQNLGNAEWQLGRTGEAILAWERAKWVNAYNRSAVQNLKFARKTEQLESPDLAWYEVISTWLPVNWWPWLTGISLWGAVFMMAGPALLRRRKATWHQGFGAFGLMVFLLSVPAHFGVESRSRMGFILEKNTPLRLTPTRDAQAVTHLAAGDPVRAGRIRGDYVLVRTGRANGWVQRSQVGLICPAKGAVRQATTADAPR